eukprot:scaffold977_cov253-Pinguiococcus_pyrenoidosus.AAC.22
MAFHEPREPVAARWYVADAYVRGCEAREALADVRSPFDLFCGCLDTPVFWCCKVATTSTAEAAAAEATSAAAVAAASAVTAAAAATAIIALTSVVTGAEARASASTTASAPPEGRAGEVLQPRRHFLVVLRKQVEEVPRDLAVAVVHEAQCVSDVADAPRTPDAVDVVVDVVGHVVVDHLRDSADIEATGRHVGRDEDGRLAALERLQRILALALGAVSVNRGRREAGATQVLLNVVRGALGFHEDEDEALVDRVQKINEDAILVARLHPLHALRHVLGGGADSTDGQENVVEHEITGKLLNLSRKSGTEHECLAIRGPRHVLLFHDAPDLRLEAHVQHAVGLVENQETAALEAHAAALEHVHEASGRRHQEITAALAVRGLRAEVRTAVDDHRSDARPIAKPLRLFVDLRRELSGRGEDERHGARLVPPARGRRVRRAVLEHGADEREEEASRLPRARLRACHEVSAGLPDGNRILLDRRWLPVICQLRVSHQVLADGLGREHLDVLRRVLSAHFNRNVVILVEIDTRCLLVRLLEQISFKPRVLVQAPVEAALVLTRATTTTAVAASAITSSATASAVVVVSSSSTVVAAVIIPPAVARCRRAAVAPAATSVIPTASIAVATSIAVAASIAVATSVAVAAAAAAATAARALAISVVTLGAPGAARSVATP